MDVPKFTYPSLSSKHVVPSFFTLLNNVKFALFKYLLTSNYFFRFLQTG